MSLEQDHLDIEEAITNFAQAYGALEKLQRREAKKQPHESLLPRKGDQKTGLIGEYWAIRYARTIYPGAQISFGGHSEKGWDLKIDTRGDNPKYIQVKTASAFGSRKLSRICKPQRSRAEKGEEELPDYWNELWLLWLDQSFRPVTLWKLEPKHVTFDDVDCLTNKSLRRTPLDLTSGSDCFDWENAEAITDICKRLGLKPSTN